jgi:hypothetical protein
LSSGWAVPVRDIKKRLEEDAVLTRKLRMQPVAPNTKRLGKRMV